MMDSGVITIYAVENAGERGGHVQRRCTQRGLPEYFEDRVVGLNRYYAARQANVTADRLVRIWRRDDVSPQDVATIQGTTGFFRIRQVQHVDNEDGLPCTDLTLERLVEHYDIARPDDSSC